MSIFLDEAKSLRLYTGTFYYPIDMTDRFHNSIIYLMTPNKNESIKVLNHFLTRFNKIQFSSYFIEKNIDYIINNKFNESSMLDINGEQYEGDYNLLESLQFDQEDEVSLSEASLNINAKDFKERIYFNDFVDELLSTPLNEQDERFRTRFGIYNLTAIFRNMLFKDRMKSQQDCLLLYKEIRNAAPFIKFTFINPKLYKNRNIYYDWSYYTNIFFKKNNLYKSDRGLDVFFAFMNRFVSDPRFSKYNKRTIVIPVNSWCTGGARETPFDYHNFINPISLFVRDLKMNPSMFTPWNNIPILFLADRGFFVLKLNEFDINKDLQKFKNLILRLLKNDYSDAENISYDSRNVIINQIADKLADGGIKLHNLTGGTKELTKDNLKDMGLLDNPETSDDSEVKKAVLVNKLDDIAKKATTTDDAMKELESNEDNEVNNDLKEILISVQSDDNIKMDKARTDRMNETRKKILKDQVKGKSVKQLLDQFKSNNDLKEEPLDIDSLDDSWKHLKFNTFNESYTKEDMDADIVAVFTFLNHVTHPMNILNIDVKNVSTSEDYVNEWNVKYEDAETGKRFTIDLLMPRLINDRFMKLGGNEKVLLSQFMLLPVIKTDVDEVQVVSNYNKIFISRKSPSGFGKSTAIVNKLMRSLQKYNGRNIKVREGDNRKICNKYQLPIDYIDLASIFNDIKFSDGSYISFNPQKLEDIPFDRSTIIDKSDNKLSDTELNKKYLAIYVNKDGKKEIIDPKLDVDEYTKNLIFSYDKDGKFEELYNSVSISKKLMYSQASIMNMKIPLICVLSYNIGLQKVLDKHGIKYKFSETRPSKSENFITFSDGYLIYETPNGQSDSLLINGLTQINTTEYSIRDINDKEMWLDVLDDYGGRIKADGLDNFYDLMMDPITKEICKDMNIPDDYIGAMLYANDLLIDNKYNRHTDISCNRLRTNEIIVGHLYLILSKAFGAYRNQVKRNKGQALFSVKKNAVIDSILNHDQTSSDLSSLTPLLEAEAAAKVTFKGLSGMNSERAFSIDKRTYDKSMLGVVGMSTGFASTVGINRQLTIDSSIKNKRGFINSKKPKELNNANTFSIMEAMSPMAVNHDDPFRTAMAYTQTSQHQVSVQRSMPMLVTSGADQVLPYITSNKFSYKFKGRKGHVKELTKDYMIIENDDTKECEYVDLRETIRKNSDGGFYITTKLDPIKGIKVGDKLKYNDIVAYDPKSYSPSIGSSGKKASDISYNMGTLAKVAIMNSDMGFEDSCVVDQYVSDALTTELCFLKDVNIDKNSNVYNLVKPGQPVEADDTLLVFQDAFDEKEANELLRKISMDQDEISDIGRKHIRSKVAGVVQDVKIYRTVDLDKLSPTLQDICKKYDAKIDKLKKVMRKNNIDREYTLEPTGKLPQQGKLKNFEGVRIEIYVKTKDAFGSGDKLVFYEALKGVTSYVIPKDVSPSSEYRPNERVNSFLSAIGVFKRMVPSAFLLGLTNKLIIELTRQCQEELGIKWRPLQEIMESDRK